MKQNSFIHSDLVCSHLAYCTTVYREWWY